MFKATKYIFLESCTRSEKPHRSEIFKNEVNKKK